jgi:hypothetical protein
LSEDLTYRQTGFFGPMGSMLKFARDVVDHFVHWKGPISRGARLANLASRVKHFLRPLTKAELSTSKAVAPERSHGGGVGSSSTS